MSGFILTDENEYFEGYDGRRFKTKIGSFKQYEDRICRNSPIQSIASDINLMACIKIQKYVQQHSKSWKLLNIVHDSIIAEIKTEEVPDYIEKANEIMINNNILQDFDVKTEIPLVADFTVGSTWADQVNVSVVEEYVVKCKECKAKREETERPKNRRCEKCGSKNIELELKSGPLDLVLRYWKHKLQQGNKNV